MNLALHVHMLLLLLKVLISFFFKHIQLSDVMYGGATVFPKLNARVPVQKVNDAQYFSFRLNGPSWP